jgi:hypothetical protein
MLEQEWILTRTNESVLHNYEEAVSKMFGVKNKNNIMLAVIDVVLKENELLKDKNEAKEKK